MKPFQIKELIEFVSQKRNERMNLQIIQDKANSIIGEEIEISKRGVKDILHFCFFIIILRNICGEVNPLFPTCYSIDTNRTINYILVLIVY